MSSKVEIKYQLYLNLQGELELSSLRLKSSALIQLCIVTAQVQNNATWYKTVVNGRHSVDPS